MLLILETKKEKRGKIPGNAINILLTNEQESWSDRRTAMTSVWHLLTLFEI